jgi:hypothetical protein
MKKLLLSAFISLFVLSAKSQSLDYTYKTAIGVKVWDGGGFTIKHFVNEKAALEGIVYFWDNSFRITGLYEFHGDISGAKGLKWYIGPGAHIGFYQYHNDPYYNDNNETYIGIDGVIGLDYKFNKAPINISLDWQPSFEFGTNRGFVGSWGGLGVRYAW